MANVYMTASGMAIINNNIPIWTGQTNWNIGTDDLVICKAGQNASLSMVAEVVGGAHVGEKATLLIDNIGGINVDSILSASAVYDFVDPHLGGTLSLLGAGGNEYFRGTISDGVTALKIYYKLENSFTI